MIERRLVDNIIDNAGPICHTCAPTIFRNFHAFSLLCMQISSPRTPWHALFSKLFYHASFCVLNICAVKNELRNGGKIRYVYSRTLFVSIRHKYFTFQRNIFIFFLFWYLVETIFEKLICMRTRGKKLQLWRLMRARSPAYWVVMHGSALFPWRRL